MKTNFCLLLLFCMNFSLTAEPPYLLSIVKEKTYKNNIAEQYVKILCPIYDTLKTRSLIMKAIEEENLEKIQEIISKSPNIINRKIIFYASRYAATSDNPSAEKIRKLLTNAAPANELLTMDDVKYIMNLQCVHYQLKLLTRHKQERDSLQEKTKKIYNTEPESNNPFFLSI